MFYGTHRMGCLCETAPRVAILGVFMFGYICIGAVIFRSLEEPAEVELRNKLRIYKAQFLRNFTCLEDEDLEDFIVKVLHAHKRGVSALRNVSTEPNWSFGQAVFFAGTVLTTIGYGHVTPLSEGGKVFCVIYAALGIPLTLILFTAIVERLMLLTNKLLTALQTRFGANTKPLTVRLLHLTIILSILIVFVFLIPSIIFTALEAQWNFLDSFYYCFISMTTIGLGDYIPGDNEGQMYRPLYKICTTFYLFIGLIFMMMSLATVYEIPEMNLGSHFYLRGDDEDSEKQSLRPSDNSIKYTEHVNDGYDKGTAESAMSQ